MGYQHSPLMLTYLYANSTGSTIVRAEQSKFDYLFSAIMPNFLRT
jgi:hypothetical protein